MPALKMDVDVKVEDDDEDKITAGSIVTITTKLTRESMGDIIESADNGEVSLIVIIGTNRSLTTPVLIRNGQMANF